MAEQKISSRTKQGDSSKSACDLIYRACQPFLEPGVMRALPAAFSANVGASSSNAGSASKLGSSANSTTSEDGDDDAELTILSEFPWVRRSEKKLSERAH